MRNISFFAVLLIILIAPFSSWAQIATTGIPAPQLYGSGSPSASVCNSSTKAVSYIQTDALNGRLWLCDTTDGTNWAWNHVLNPVQGIATTGTIAATTLLGLTLPCTSVSTITMPGATVGVNAATASPIYATSPTGNMGYFNLNAWVSATNTVSVQGCIPPVTGINVSVPAFQAKVLMY